MYFVREVLLDFLITDRYPAVPEGRGIMQKPAPDSETTRPAPHYVEITRVLAAAIQSGSLADGTVLTEGPVADLFGTSRTPVRTAFTQLLDDKLIRRFEGRGFVVGTARTTRPERRQLTPPMLGLDPGERTEPRPDAARLIESRFQKNLAGALPFGLYRINEQAAADHFGVSRNIVRDLLGRFRDRGLVRKDLRSHWVIGPLTARDVAHFFTIRARLEPLALLESAPKTSPAELERMRAALADALAGRIALDAERCAALEQDLHVTLLARCANPHLLRMIRQTQVAMVVNRVFADHVGARPFEIGLREHEMVLEFLVRKSPAAAAQVLQEHVSLAAERTRQRLITLSVFPEPVTPLYLQKQTP
jgi:DNA-binding GntR family transcriptional regulator